MTAAIVVRPPGHLAAAGRMYRCAVGRAGIGIKAGEGDGVTPAGEFPLRRVLYRADRLSGEPSCRLPTRPLRRDDGWCDDPASPRYNRLVRLPFPWRHERLWRDDPLYDLVVVVGYNDDPVVAGRGSAIFLHVARDGFAATEGCVALALADLVAVVGCCGPETRLRIRAG